MFATINRTEKINKFVARRQAALDRVKDKADSAMILAKSRVVTYEDHVEEVEKGLAEAKDYVTRMEKLLVEAKERVEKAREQEKKVRQRAFAAIDFRTQDLKSAEAYVASLPTKPVKAKPETRIVYGEVYNEAGEMKRLTQEDEATIRGIVGHQEVGQLTDDQIINVSDVIGRYFDTDVATFYHEENSNREDSYYTIWSCGLEGKVLFTFEDNGQVNFTRIA